MRDISAECSKPGPIRSSHNLFQVFKVPLTDTAEEDAAVIQEPAHATGVSSASAPDCITKFILTHHSPLPFEFPPEMYVLATTVLLLAV